MANTFIICITVIIGLFLVRPTIIQVSKQICNRDRIIIPRNNSDVYIVTTDKCKDKKEFWR